MLELGEVVYYPVLDFYNSPNMTPTIHKGKILEIIRSGVSIIRYSIQPYEISTGGFDSNNHHHEYSKELKSKILIIEERMVFKTELEAICYFGKLGLKIATSMFNSLTVGE